MGESKTTELINSVNKEKRPSNDPNDYFRLTQFRKIGRKVCSDIPWEKVFRDDFYLNDDKNLILIGLTPSNKSQEDGIVGVIKGPDLSVTKVNLPAVSEDLRILALDLIDGFTARLSKDKRALSARNVFETIGNSQNLSVEEVSNKIVKKQLELFEPVNKTSVDSTDSIKRIIDQMPPDQSQKRQELQNLLVELSQKMDFDTFSRKAEKFTKDIKREDRVWDQNYKHLPNRFLRWLLEDSNLRNYDEIKRPPLAKFPVKENITKEIINLEDLERVLQEIPYQVAPDVFSLKRKSIVAEFIDLDLVAGVNDAESWFIDDSKKKGSEKIFELTQGYQNGNIPFLQEPPIKAIRYKNKIWISGDGRHRMAALKALGVKKVPVLLDRIIESD